MKTTLTAAAGLLLLISLGVFIKAYVINDDANAPGVTTGHGDTPPQGEPVADCRALAPDDPYADDEANSESAYAACREAATLAPNDAEILYLLGTSALQSDRPDEAVESFSKAEQFGHCKALYFLGDDAWYGRHDAESAEDYYKRGAECGDERAAREVFSPERFAKSDRPDLLAALYNSDTATLNKVRFANASYVAGFYEAMSEQYLGTRFDPCWTVRHYRGGKLRNALLAAEKGDASNIFESAGYEFALPVMFRLLMPELGSQALDEFREAQRKAGHADLIRMVESSKCDALLPYKIVKGIEEFAQAKRPLLEVAKEAAPHIKSQGDFLEWLRQKN